MFVRLQSRSQNPKGESRVLCVEPFLSRVRPKVSTNIYELLYMSLFSSAAETFSEAKQQLNNMQERCCSSQILKRRMTLK